MPIFVYQVFPVRIPTSACITACSLIPVRCKTLPEGSMIALKPVGAD